MYFWENNYERARQWAEDKKKRGTIKNPAVIGAILHLNYCCDLLDSEFIRILTAYHRIMQERYNALGKKLPQNKDLPFDIHKDKILEN